MPKLVRVNNDNRASIQFWCNECNKQFITTINELGTSFVCPNCRARVNTLPVLCHYEDCGGRYELCGGTIRKLTGEELAAEEKKAYDIELDTSVGAAPTDSFHEDISDIRGSIITYKCDRCGDSYSASYGNSHQFDHKTVICQRILCSSCKRFPALSELPEPEGRYDARPSALWREPI